VRLLPKIRYGTERYPEKVARRLRALNITTWIASATSAGYGIQTLLDSAPGLWKLSISNTLVAVAFAAIPLLHRFGPLAAASAFIIVLYVNLVVLLPLLGTGTGMQMYYLVGTALTVLSSVSSISSSPRFLAPWLRQ